MKSLAKSRWNPYPWDDWFTSKSFVLTRGKHYSCMTHSMAQMVRNSASKLNLKVHLNIVDETTISVQVLGRTDA